MTRIKTMLRKIMMVAMFENYVKENNIGGNVNVCPACSPLKAALGQGTDSSAGGDRDAGEFGEAGKSGCKRCFCLFPRRPTSDFVVAPLSKISSSLLFLSIIFHRCGKYLDQVKHWMHLKHI